MAMTTATRDKRIAEVQGRIDAATETAREYRRRAANVDERIGRLRAEVEWLQAAPVTDPPPPAPVRVELPGPDLDEGDA